MRTVIRLLSFLTLLCREHSETTLAVLPTRHPDRR